MNALDHDMQQSPAEEMPKSYSELLQSSLWKDKCFHILKRDGNRCQDCQCQGIHNGTYFPIEKVSELNDILPVTLNGMKWESFCNSCEWRNNLLSPIRFTHRFIGNNLYYYSLHNYTYHEVYNFISDKLLFDVQYKMAIDNEVRFSYNNQLMKGRMFALQFDQVVSNRKYASIACRLSKGTGLYETITVRILSYTKLYYFEFSRSNFESQEPLFQFPSLHIHHQYYVQGKKPWEYDDAALVTLCADCHQKRHATSSIPLYNNAMRIVKSSMPLCGRCAGSGYLPEYHYYMGGICFRCWGEGVIV